MIEVTAFDDDGNELAQLRITRVSEQESGECLYVVAVAVDRMGAIGLHSKTFLHDRTKGNTLALIKAALNSLDEEHMEFENGKVGPSDLARRKRGALGAVQAWKGRLYRH